MNAKIWKGRNVTSVLEHSNIHVVHPSDMFSHSFIPHILHGHTMSDTMICTKYLNIQGMLHTTDMPPDLMNHIFGQD